jgi:hypothetical protein
MNNRQSRLLAAAESAIIFALDLKKAPSRIIDAAKRLKEAVRSARGAAQQQSGAKHYRRVPRYSVRRAKTILLRKHLDPIVADGLEMFAGLPGIEESLQVPRIKDAPEKHLEAAKRVHRVAEEHEDEFIEQRNYNDNFLEKFQEAVRDLEAAARVERGFARAKYTRATEDVKEEITRVRRAFDALDARMLEAYLDDRHTLRQWRKASRVPAKTGRPKQRKAGVKRGDRARVRESPVEIGR